jgi:hypothetical protein
MVKRFTRAPRCHCNIIGFLTLLIIQHGWIKLALSLNKDQVRNCWSSCVRICRIILNPAHTLQFLCLCIAAAGTGGAASACQQLLVLDAKDGRVAWTVPFTPSKSVRINCAWYLPLAAPVPCSHAVLQRLARSYLLHHRVNFRRVCAVAHLSKSGFV